MWLQVIRFISHYKQNLLKPVDFRRYNIFCHGSLRFAGAMAICWDIFERTRYTRNLSTRQKESEPKFPNKCECSVRNRRHAWDPKSIREPGRSSHCCLLWIAQTLEKAEAIGEMFGLSSDGNWRLQKWRSSRVRNPGRVNSIQMYIYTCICIYIYIGPHLGDQKIGAAGSKYLPTAQRGKLRILAWRWQLQIIGEPFEFGFGNYLDVYVYVCIHIYIYTHMYIQCIYICIYI